MRKKDVILNFRPSSKTRFILERLGFINKNGRVVAEHGGLSEFINLRINTYFSSSTDQIETEWRKHLMQEKYNKIEKLKEEVAELGKQIVDIKTKAI